MRESYASLRERFASLRNDTSSLREKLEQLSNGIILYTLIPFQYILIVQLFFYLQAVRIQEEKIAQRDVRDICKRFRLTLLYMLAPYVTEDVGEFDTTPKLHLREKWTKENPTIFRDKLREHLTTGVMERFLASEFDLDGASLLHLLDTAKNIEDEAENDVLEMFRKLPTQ